MKMRRAFRVMVAVMLVSGLLAVPTAYAAAKVSKVKASVDNQYPKQYSSVTAKAKVLDASGRPIKNAKVVFKWYYKSSTPREVKYTNSSGIAYCKRGISRAAVGYKVVVKATATSGGVTKTGSTWFIPKKR